jgi:hypothetical protein
MSQSLTERYDDRIAGVLSCYDRLVITGTVPVICYAEGMTRFLYAKGIRIFDYPVFAMKLRDRVRDVAASLAATAGITIEHIAKSHIRKEEVVARALAQRGDHPGLVYIISAMEACNWLARQLTAAGIDYTMADNAFARIDDWNRAQELADALSPDRLHRILDHYAEQCCPVCEVFGQTYHWSLMQVEYATDLAFRSTTTLGPLYEQLVRQSVLSVKAEQVASFLGRQITPQLAQEIGSQFSTRIEGTCIKHRFAKSSIKMYDKCGIVLRIETTTNDVSFFKHHRKVEHRDRPPTRELAPVKKSIYTQPTRHAAAVELKTVWRRRASQLRVDITRGVGSALRLRWTRAGAAPRQGGCDAMPPTIVPGGTARFLDDGRFELGRALGDGRDVNPNRQT